MRFIYNILLLALLAVVGLAATAEQKPYIVSYPQGTPDSVVEEAMEAVRKAVRLPDLAVYAISGLSANRLQGGKITHEYNLIKGFAAKIADETIDAIHALGEGKHIPTIEEDKVVSINKDQ